MTGPDLRALLTSWRVTRSMFADALALGGYYIEPKHVTMWSDRVPVTAVKLIEQWRDHPEQRPVFRRRDRVSPRRSP